MRVAVEEGSRAKRGQRKKGESPWQSKEQRE